MEHCSEKAGDSLKGPHGVSNGPSGLGGINTRSLNCNGYGTPCNQVKAMNTLLIKMVFKQQSRCVSAKVGAEGEM